MAGIFASQFRYAPTYPVGLATGTPQVGVNLPRTPEDDDEEEKTPAEKSPVTAPLSSPVSAGANAGANASAGANALSSQAISSMIHAPAAVASASHASTSAPASVGHSIASVFDSARHSVASGLDAVNNVAESPVVRDVMNFGSSNHSTGIVGLVNSQSSSAPVPGAQQDIKVNSMRLNEGSPSYDVETPQYALPRAWSANAVGSGSARPAIEAPGSSFDPLQSMIDRPTYSAMPRGWSANDSAPDFSSMVDSPVQAGRGWSANVNPIQFNDIPENASPLPRGMSANGGWMSDVGNIANDIGDALG